MTSMVLRNVLQPVCGILLLVTGGFFSSVMAAPSEQAVAVMSGSEVASTARAVIHMLDYISVDYPGAVSDGKVLNDVEYQEQLEFSVQVKEQLGKLPENPEKDALLRRADRLWSKIDARSAAAEVSALANELRGSVISAYKVAVSPGKTPDLQGAAALYASQCASCHGAEGKGDGAAAAGMEPAPANFHDADRMAQRSVYGLYNTISLGVEGTPMAAYSQLSEENRWVLAFYVASLAASKELLDRGAAAYAGGGKAVSFANLRDLAMLTENEIREHQGEAAIAVFAWLKKNPGQLASGAESPLAFTARHLDESVAAYRAGNVVEAQRLAVTGYLEGFELVEASLNMADGDLRKTIEDQMTAYRNLLRAGVPVSEVEAHAGSLHTLLASAASSMESSHLSATAALVSSFFIIVREGLESLLVVAVILTFLVRAERRDALPYVHFGWISALVLGGITWFVASYLISISGASREITEGLAALAASVILLYVGFWLHDKAHAGRWREFVGKHLEHALSRGTLWALAGVSFLAVYREAFETVLFYQALWQQAAGAESAVLSGLGLGCAVLALMGWLIFRFGSRLPVGPFFAWSSVMLVALGIMFAGHGVAGLQEAGWLPVDPVSFFQMPALGVYANRQALLLQGILLALVVVIFMRNRTRKTVAS